MGLERSISDSTSAHVSRNGTPESPRISVLIATHNRRDVLPRALQSVLHQTFDDIEIVVVDDEPDERTAAVVKSLGDPRIRYIRHDENRGLSAARQTGVNAATGEYVAFLDDDDEWDPRKLELQLKVAEACPKPVVVHCHERWVKPDGSSIIRAIDLHGDVHSRLLQRDQVLMQTLLVPRDAFRRVGPFDSELTNYMDMDMNIRLSAVLPYVTVPLPLLIGHVTVGSLSQNEPNRIKALERILEKYPEYREDRRLRSRWTYRIARKYQSIGRPDLWRSRMMEAIRLNPLNGRAWLILLLGVLVGPDVHSSLSARWNRLLRNMRKRAFVIAEGDD